MPNIALVKYWGKKCEREILPINSSLSLTLGQDFLTSTRILLSPTQAHNLTLNGRNISIPERLGRVLDEFQQHAGKPVYYDILSDNHFPTSSGMASSASGYAAVSLALNSTLERPLPWEELLRLTRIGSGSAVRSMKGGLVEWDAATGLIHQRRSVAEVQEMRIIVLLDDVGEKEVSSSEGMTRSKRTSELMQYRPQLASLHIQQLLQAFEAKDYREVSRLIRTESNQLHAVCTDSLPPIFYLSSFSQQMITLVEKHLLELTEGELGYTFDAGSHCFLIFPERHERTLLRFFQKLFAGQHLDFNETARFSLLQPGNHSRVDELAEHAIGKGFGKWRPKKVILSRVGSDPISYNG